MNRTPFLSALFLGLVLILSVQTASGQTPQTISYQGVLSKALGKAAPDGHYQFTFQLYDAAAGGTSLWSETQAVMIVNGIFKVNLGSVHPLNLPFDKPYWLGMTIGEEAELTPRIELTASAYSFHARSLADSAVTSRKIAAGQVVRSLNSIRDDVTLAAGDNVTITQKGDSLILSASIGIDHKADGEIIKSVSDNLTSAAGGNATGQPWKTDGNKNIDPTQDFLGTTDPVDLVIKTNNAEHMRVTPSGNVGIGTNSPNEKLSVAGTVESTSGGFKFPDGSVQATAATVGQNNNAGDPTAAVGGGQNNTASGTTSTVAGGSSNTASGQSAAVPGGDSNTAAGDFSLAAGQQAKANHDGAFVWADASNADFASSAPNQFLIRASGGVGIGMSNPQAELDVAGEIHATDELSVGNSVRLLTNPDRIRATTGTLSFEDDHLITTGNVTAASFFGDGSNLTGINVNDADANPANELNTSLVLNGTNLQITDAAGTLSADLSSLSGGDGHSLNAADGSPTDALFVDNNGSVGIGTTNPNHLLHLYGTVVAEHVLERIQNSDNSGYSTLWLGAGNDGILRGGASAPFWTNQLVMVTSGSSPVVLATNATERLRVDGSGNVGIGTTSPGSNAKFEVNGVGASDYALFSDFTTASLRIGNDGGGNLRLRTDGAQHLVFSPGGNELVRFTTYGNVGIGTTNPNGLLTLNKSTDNAQISFQNGGVPKAGIGLEIQGGQIVVGSSPNDLGIRTVGGNIFFSTRSSGIVDFYISSSPIPAVFAYTYGYLSDATRKTNVTPLGDVLDKLEQIRGVSYELIDEAKSPGTLEGPRQIGVLAQEVQAVFPELVSTIPGDGYLAVEYGKLSAVLIEAVKELRAEKDAEIATLKAENAALQQQLDDMETRLAALERTIRR